MGVVIGAAIWVGISVVAMQIDDYRRSARLLNVIYLGATVAASSFFLFALEYTGREQFITRRVLSGLAIEPILVQALLWTDGYHELFFTERFARETAIHGVSSTKALGFWVHTGYSYLLTGAGIVMLLAMAYNRRRIYRRQLLAIVLAACVPIVTNLVSVLELTPVYVTPEGFVITAVVLSTAVFQYDFTDLMPVARSMVVENITDGVLVLDEFDRIIDINPDGRRLLGLRGDAILGQHAEAVFEERAAIWETIARLDEGSTEIDIETEDGRQTVSVRVSTLEDSKGRHRGRLVTIRDITGQKRRERELERQNEQLDQFASLLSHDLRNPLNVANGYLDVIMNAEDPERMREYAAEIEHSHERIETLIQDVLTLTREGKAVEDPTPTGLRAVANEAWETVETAEATLHVETDLVIQADKTRLLRVFENLYRNALDHGPEDVTVQVGGIGEFDPGSVLTEQRRGFYVADDGPGIPPDQRDKVLEQGFTTSEEGTGLGLSIVGTVVEAHGWEISVTESTEGGARFEITNVSLAGSQPTETTSSVHPNENEAAAHELDIDR
jgi:PAS domain S-box-containing protein